MKRLAVLSLLVLAAAFAAVPVVSAQNVAPVRIRNAPPAVQGVDAPANRAEDTQVNTDIVDPQGTIDRLRADNRQLKEDNTRLQGTVADLDARIAAMTTRGGSAVMAYCESPNESRNTAGAAQACGPYRCDEVSGQCRDRCTLTEHCAVGSCDIRYGVCSETPLD